MHGAPRERHTDHLSRVAFNTVEEIHQPRINAAMPTRKRTRRFLLNALSRAPSSLSFSPSALVRSTPTFSTSEELDVESLFCGPPSTAGRMSAIVLLRPGERTRRGFKVGRASPYQDRSTVSPISDVAWNYDSHVH
jgi:hypothetical protein